MYLCKWATCTVNSCYSWKFGSANLKFGTGTVLFCPKPPNLQFMIQNTSVWLRGRAGVLLSEDHWFNSPVLYVDASYWYWTLILNFSTSASSTWHGSSGSSYIQVTVKPTAEPVHRSAAADRLEAPSVWRRSNIHTAVMSPQWWNNIRTPSDWRGQVREKLDSFVIQTRQEMCCQIKTKS